MRAEHFAVVNGFHPCETGKCSHSFDSLRMAHVIDLEAFPEPHREAGMKPRSELMLLEFNPHLCLVTPSWFLERARGGEERGLSTILSPFCCCLTPSLIILQLYILERDMVQQNLTALQLHLLGNCDCNASFVFDVTS